MKAMIILLFILLLILLICPEIAAEGGSAGLILWAGILVPALLPFSVLTSLLRLRVQGTPYRYILLFAGILSGYPIGAKIAGELYSDGSITKRQAVFFAGFTNNPSPMFILFFLSGNLLSLGHERYLFIFLILVSSFLGSLVFVLCFLPEKPGKESPSLMHKSQKTHMDFFRQVDEEIGNTSLLLLKIGGYITLFSIFTAFISHLTFLPESIRLLLCGILEITTGTSQIASSALTSSTKIILILAATTFGGLSAAAQTNGVLSKTGLSILHYIAVKTLNSLFSLLLAFLFFRIFR